MKDKLAVILCVFAACIYLSSCAGGAGGDSGSGVQDEVFTGGGESHLFNLSYSGIKDISSSSVRVIEVPNTSGYWSENVGKGKKVFFIRTNVADNVIDKSYVQKISETTGFTNSGRSLVNTDMPYARQQMKDDNNRARSNYLSRSGTSRVSRGVDTPKTKYWDIGDERELWLEDGNGNYSKKNVRLYAKNMNCYVWCVPDEATSFTKLSSLASVFDSVCLPVIYLSGSPCSDMFGKLSGNDLEQVSMYGYSPTGSMMNIVVYDIGSDSSNGSFIGFFASRDYYPDKEDLGKLAPGLVYKDSDRDLNYSNEGQFIYLDSWYLRNKYGTALSTLVHEFHHLIIWGQKYMKNKKLMGDEWNEMLSMMCEDLLQAKISQEASSFSFWDSPAQRLPYFEGCYINAGLELRRDSQSATVMSYSTLYAFGAWLLRNFGGAELFARMARSSYIDESMVVEAVNSVNGTNYTLENLIGMFAVSCVAPKYEYTMNRDAVQTRFHSLSGYSFPSRAVDLWNLNKAAIKGLSDAWAIYDGCGFFSSKDVCNIRPYGMILSYVGETSSDIVSVYFGNAYVSKNMRLYMVVTNKD